MLVDEGYNYYKNLTSSRQLDRAFTTLLDPSLFAMVSCSAFLLYLYDVACSYLLTCPCPNILKHVLTQNIHIPTQQQGVQGYASIFNQRQIVMLGRTINISKAAIHHIHMCMFRDIDAAVRRFEAGDACGVIALYNLLDILRKTHGKKRKRGS